MAEYEYKLKLENKTWLNETFPDLEDPDTYSWIQ